MSKIKDSTWFTQMGKKEIIGLVATEDNGAIRFYIGAGSGSTAAGSQKLDEEAIAATGAEFDPEYIADFCSRHGEEQAPTPKAPANKEEARLWRGVINRLNNPERSNACDAAILKKVVTEALNKHEEARSPVPESWDSVMPEPAEPILSGVALEPATQMTPMSTVPLQDFMTTITIYDSNNIGRSGDYNDTLNQAFTAITNSGGEDISVQISDTTGPSGYRQAFIHYKAPIGSQIYI